MRKLMIVDDEAVVTTQLEQRLESMKYDVVGTASSAEESVCMARDLCPDLILMDIVMKGKLDGIDAARIIKEDMDIPVIFLTAYADDKYINRAMLAEPFGYIVKPYRENEIMANIEIALYKKELERKHKQAEERICRLFLAIEHNPYAVLIMDVEGNVEYANPEFVQLTNYAPKEVLGKDFFLFKSEELLPEVHKDMWEAITYGEEWRGELSIRKKDGTPDLIYTIALPVKNTKGDIVFFIVIIEEIIKRNKRRDVLLESEKLNSLMTIVTGISHEFNNILAVVHGSAELLGMGYDDEKELKNGLHSIMDASKKGAGIVRKMFTVIKSDKDTADYIFFDLRHLIMRAIDFTFTEWENKVQAKGINYTFDKDGIKDIPNILCNTSELNEVFINIINNALDAMPDGGCISFSTWSSKGSVFVSISDTGEGMSEEVKMKIFDPFFTTRRPQRTGLGMCIVNSVIARHGGGIEVTSGSGKGTTITMSIPISKEA